MEKLLGWIIEFLAWLHDRFLSINDGRQWGLDDKQLHFVVIGVFGIGLFFAVQILFKWLAKRSVTAISWIYTLTVVLVVTFAIEIGQRASGGGDMEAGDIYYGVWGFIAAFVIYLAVKGIMLLLKKFFVRQEDNTPPGVRHYIGDRRGGRSKKRK